MAAAFGGSLRAQEATGSLEVVLGAAIPDRVRLAAPGLARETTPDHRGAAWFLQLPPGRYRLEAGAACPSQVDVRPGERRVVRCSGPADANGAPSEAAAAAAGARPREAGFDLTTEITADELRTTPRPADPWSALRDVAGVVVDRVDVGGSDSEQQSLLVSHGDAGTGAAWNLDGVEVTDPAALGTTLVYPDMDALETLVARTAAIDVRVRTPGVQVGLALRPAGERLTGALHARGSWDGLQADNVPRELEGRPFFRNRTDHVSELGAEVGGPVFAGRAWLFGAVFRNALAQEAFTEHEEELRTSGITAKGRVRLGGGTLRLLALRTQKVHEDRDTGLSSSHEARWRQSGPTWLLAVEDQRRVAGLDVLSHLSFTDGGFRLEPYGGDGPSAFEDFRGVLQRSYQRFETERRRLRAGAEAAAERQAFGARHSLVGGASYARAPVSTVQSWPGNEVVGLERQGVFFRTFRLTGFATPYRESEARSITSGFSAYAADEVRFSRVTASLGLRFERLSGSNEPSSVRANSSFPELLPAVTYDGSGQEIVWTNLLPRAAVAVSLGARTQLRAGYAAYAAPLGPGEVTFDNPLRDLASLTYYWRDTSGDSTVQPGELDLVRGRLGASGFDPDRPAEATSPQRIDPDLGAPITREVHGGAERQLGRTTSLNLRVTWRRLTHALWRPLQNLTASDYAVTGAVQGSLFGDDYAVTYYAPASTSELAPGNGRVLTNRDGYVQDSLVTEVGARGRVGETLDWLVFAAYSDWRERFLDREVAVQDPTPTESEPLVNAGLPVVRPGGLGRGDLFVGARFAGGLQARARLPLGLRAAGRLYMREGFPVPYFQVASTGDITAGSKNVLVTERLDRYRLPGLVLLDLRLERGMSLGRGRLTVSLDVFNVTNAATRLQVVRDVELPAFDRAREIVRPRLARLGLDWRF